MPTKICDKLIASLLAHGYQLSSTASSNRYMILTNPELAGKTNKDRYYRVYVGDHGSLRGGRTIADSIPLNRTRLDLIAQYDASHKNEPKAPRNTNNNKGNNTRINQAPKDMNPDFEW